MITYICGTNGIHYSKFPDSFWEEFRNIMNNGDEILLGNSDFDHRVYGRCRTREYESVSVMKSVPSKRFNSLVQVKADIPRYVEMLKKCDRMVAVWDGMSQEVLINLLLLLALNKKCRLFLTSGSFCEIGTIEDLKPFVTECHGWTTEDIREVLRKCGFSEEMIAYNTMDEDFVYREHYIAEIICKAPVSLKEKYEMLEKLSEKNNMKYDDFLKLSELIAQGADFEQVKQTICDATGDAGLFIEDCCAAIDSAVFDLEFYCDFEEKLVYCLFDEWYDHDVFIVKSSPSGVFNSLKDVMKYIKQEEKFEKDNWDDDDDEEPKEGYPIASWYKIEVWTFGGDGAWESSRYNYYIYKDEICWFEELRLKKEKNGYKYYFVKDCERSFLGGLLDLNMPTPFKPGDIVNIDCSPFGPSFHAMITEARAQYDCCMPQILFRMPYTDKWKLEALKHKRFYKEAESHSYEPALSPLYRIRYVREDELRDSDELLVRLSKELNGDEEKASAFWDAFRHGSLDGVSVEDVMKAWDAVNSSENPSN